MPLTTCRLRLPKNRTKTVKNRFKNRKKPRGISKNRDFLLKRKELHSFLFKKKITVFGNFARLLTVFETVVDGFCAVFGKT